MAELDPSPPTTQLPFGVPAYTPTTAWSEYSDWGVEIVVRCYQEPPSGSNESVTTTVDWRFNRPDLHGHEVLDVLLGKLRDPRQGPLRVPFGGVHLRGSALFAGVGTCYLVKVPERVTDLAEDRLG